MEAKTSQGKIQNLENEKLDLERKIKIISEENSSLLNKEINKLNNEMTIKNNNLSDCNAVINQLRNDQTQREEQIKKLNENLFDKEREIKSLVTDVETSNQSIST